MKTKSDHDMNVIAFSVVQSAIKDQSPAVTIKGQPGGIIGGKSRAESLSAERRREIAKKAAEARWVKVKTQ